MTFCVPPIFELDLFLKKLLNDFYLLLFASVNSSSAHPPVNSQAFAHILIPVVWCLKGCL